MKPGGKPGPSRLLDVAAGRSKAPAKSHSPQPPAAGRAGRASPSAGREASRSPDARLGSGSEQPREDHKPQQQPQDVDLRGLLDGDERSGGSPWEARLAAADTGSDDEEQVLAAWAKAEDHEPADPYQVLRAQRSDSVEQVTAQYKQRVGELGPGSRGVARLLKERLRRAHALLTTPEARREFDERHAELCANGKWARICYPNGLYEGAVVRARTAPGGGRGEPLREGRGATVLAGGEKYEGSYHAEKRHGVGLQLWGNGDLYVGHWCFGVMQGLGVYYYGSGSVYAGQFQAGRRQGRGRLTWRSGSSYWGQWADDARSGQGVLRLGTRRKPTAHYVGQFQDNKKHGEGVYASPSEGSYQGQFFEDELQGAGKAVFPDGGSYEGNYLDGRPHGTGVLHWAGSGDVYEGELKRGHLNGQGRMEYNSLKFANHPEPALGWRAVYQGQWLNDQPHGRGGLEGDVQYFGEWSKGVKEGYGTYTWPSGHRYVGNFEKDRRQGRGRLEWRDGATWDGPFDQDVRHGEATFSEAGPVAPTAELWQFGILAERGGVPMACTSVPAPDDILLQEQEVLSEDAEDSEQSWPGEDF